MVVLQHGQWELFSNHGFKHLSWNLWAQGRWISVSPTLNDSKHTAQSSCSEAFQLHLVQLNLLEPLFFDPYTSVWNSAMRVLLPSTHFVLFCLLFSEFLWALNLSSNLCLASLTTPPIFSSGCGWYNMLLCSEEDKERRHSWLLAYKQKEERLVDACEVKEVEFESKHRCNLLLLAHSTPGSIPAIVFWSCTKSSQTMNMNTLPFASYAMDLFFNIMVMMSGKVDRFG